MTKKNPKPVRVLMDADGVFVDFVRGVLQDAHRLTGQKLEHHHVTEWNLFDQIERLVGHNGLSHELSCRVREQLFCSKLPSLPGAEEALEKLLKLDAEKKIYFLVATSPWKSSPFWMEERSQWFHVRGLPRERVIHATIKHPIAADLFFDDLPDNVQTWQEHNPSGRGFLWNAPHNSSEEKLARCGGWADLFQVIDSHITVHELRANPTSR